MSKIQEIYEKRGFVLVAEVPEAAGCHSIMSKGEHPTLVRRVLEGSRLGCDIHFFANSTDPLPLERMAEVYNAFIEHIRGLS